MARAPIGSVRLPSIILRQYSTRERLKRPSVWPPVADPLSTHMRYVS